MNLNIAQKISLLSILLVLLTAGVVALVFYQRSSDILVEHAIEGLYRSAAQEGIKLKGPIDTIREDVRFVSVNPSVLGIIRARSGGGIDYLSNSTEEQWCSRLAVVFAEMLRAKKDYLQISFLDSMGDENIRVERINGKIINTPASELKNRKDKIYFTEPLKILQGQVYLTDLMLNRENNQIVTPHTPVMKAATPVYDSKGKVAGIVTIKMNFSRMLQHLKQSYSTHPQTVFITNNKGDYLVHNDDSKIFGYEFNQPHRAQNDFPTLARLFQPDNMDEGLTLLPSNSLSELAVVYVKIPFDAANPKRFLAIGLSQPYDDIVSDQQAVLTRSTWLALLLIITGTICAYVFSRFIVKPIKQITGGIDAFRSGKLNIDLPVNKKDEIGVLARTFDRLFKQVRISEENLLMLNTELEQKVEERTNALESELAERKRTEMILAEAEERSRLLLTSAGEGIYGLDVDGKTTFVNPAAAEMLGYTCDELIGQPMHALIHHSHADGTPYPRQECPMDAALSDGNIHRVTDDVLWRKDGGSFPVSYTSTPIVKGDKLLGAVVTFQDITERKRIDKMKNEFISTVSHELRTPLTSIRGSLGLISGDVVGELSIKARELLKIADNNTERLLLLINDILDIEKIESGKMGLKFKEVELKQFIEKALNFNIAFGSEYNVIYELKQCPEGLRILADEERLMQAMNNLLSNAVKFSPVGGIVEISVQHRGEQIRISVKDHGPGIPEDFHEHIFEKFTQSDASNTRAVGGTGLGLNIARSIIEEHNGSVSFNTELGIGTTFHIDLPEISSNEKADTVAN